MKRILMIVLAIVSLATYALGQETRATLTGRVTDSTGAVVPNAHIDIVNINTGATTIVRSNEAGVYNAPYLLPGTYKMTAQRSGFKTYVHTGLVLQTEQTITENIVLQVGTVSESVTVSAGTPLIDTSNANTGQSLTSEEVMDLPSNGRAPLGFAHLEYGAVAKGKHSMSQVRPFDNSTADDFSLGGGASSSNELLLNGVPNMENSSRTAGFSPQLDAVDAVHVDEFSANAALGDTSGGFVNITTKGGTNQLHGTASEYYNGSRPFEALPYFANPTTKITSTHFNQFGGTIGGPVVIPHLFNGRNKLFFFYAYEGYRGNSPNTVITSVPTAAERQGDFSALLGIGSQYQLYNPYQGQFQNIGGGSYWIRPTIPNNCLTATSSNCSGGNAGFTINPVATAYMKLIPMPNFNGSATKADGENNYFAYDPTSNKYSSHQGRFDYNISNSDKLFLEAHRSQYDNAQNNYFNTVLTGTTSTVILWGGQVDNVKTFTPSTNLETRLGFSRYETFSGPDSLGMNPTSVGFAGYVSQNSTALALPAMSFGDSAGIANLSGNPGNQSYFDNIQLYASFNKILGRHSLKFGVDIRSNKDSAVSPGSANGNYTFKRSNGDMLTQSPDYTADNTAQPFGSTLAMFVLGLPTSGSFNITQRYQYDNWYRGFFAQDDWKVAHNVTISMGVRLESETPLVESNNKMVQNWYPGLTNATTSASEANYSSQYSADSALITGGLTNYLPSTSNFVTTGGTKYATSGNRSAYYTAPLYLSPRVGFSWAPDYFHGTMAVRGGFGIYVNPFNDYTAGSSYGYTQSTNMNMFNSSCNSGYTPITSIDNPFPTSAVTNLAGTCANSVNPIQPVLASTMGVNAQLGNGMGWYSSVKVPYSMKLNFDVQKSFAKNWMVEVGGIHTLSIHNSYSNDVSAIPYLPLLDHTQSAHSPTAIALSNALSVRVNNPFLGTMPSFTNPATGTVVPNTTGLNTGKTVTVSTLVSGYPEYAYVIESLIPGQTINFNAFLFQLSKQMSKGLEFTFNYQWSRQLGDVYQLNGGGPLWYGATSSDFPQHASVTAIYQLPFGRGRMFGNNISRGLDEAIGGWEVTGIYQVLSGTLLGWGNVNYTGNFQGFANNPHNTHGPSFNRSGFDYAAIDPKASYNAPGGLNYRTFPSVLLRSDPTNNFDFSILKDFTIWNRIRIQPRVDTFNAFNHAQMSGANTNPKSSSFSYVTRQLNTNRTMQGGIHILF